jgi:putative ABC transport system ATP-binding protein
MIHPRTTQLELKNIYKSFSESLPILKNLNFCMNQGDIVSIVGPSGSGKSTLLSLLAGLDQPDRGEIILNGLNLHEMSEAELTQIRGQNIGIVFQQFHLMSHLTALENVMLPLEILKDSLNLSFKQIKARAEQTLDELGLKDRMEHFPSQLSGGENQRVAIGRAIVTQPKLLLADEPSGNLDVETGEKVMDLFFKIVKTHSLSTIIVTHSLQLADRCEKKYIMKQGVLVEA